MPRWPIILALALTCAWQATASDLAGRASIIDGDTIGIHGQRIRLFGVDAPESRQTCTIGGRSYHCGQDAAAALSAFIGARPVACEKRGIDRYGLMVALCRVDGEDIGAWMVSQGWALARDRYSRTYDDEELAARANKRKIWRGTFVQPWIWRERGRPWGQR